MTISVGHLDGVVRGKVASCSMKENRSGRGVSDVYQFQLEGEERQLTISLYPSERSPEAGDSVLIFLHAEFPTHCARMVYDVPDSVTP